MDHYGSLSIDLFFFGDRWLQAVRDLPTLSDFLDEYEANVVVPELRSAEYGGIIPKGPRFFWPQKSGGNRLSYDPKTHLLYIFYNAQTLNKHTHTHM